MFAKDEETYAALQALDSLIRAPQRPIVLWIGAGASRWAGYPAWDDLTHRMHSTFSREEPTYNKLEASKSLVNGNYPSAFEFMKVANRSMYHRLLVEALSPRESTGVYDRLLRSLRSIAPLHIVTTNIDEALERNLPGPELVQRSDIERLPSLLLERRSFICKLHGSASAVETAVFATSDYEAVAGDPIYLSTLRGVVSDSHCIFLGYGVRDEYVVRALTQSGLERPLFGVGPHFIVTSDDARGLPATVRQIRYTAEVADHRDALLTLEHVAEAHRQRHLPAHSGTTERPPARESVYYLADLAPPGTWTTSQTAIFRSNNGESGQMIVGPGYVDGEVVLTNYSALHDVVVGLVCFDAIGFGVEQLGKVHELVGADAFWEIVASGAFRVVFTSAEPAVIFSDEHSATGGLAFVSRTARGSTVDSTSALGVGESIRRQLAPLPGKEEQAERAFQLLESKMLDLTVGWPDDLGDQTLAALVHPSVRRLLGISGGTPLTSVPRWQAFPILRLAGLIVTGSVCQRVGASAARLIWGSERLAGAAFSASAGQHWADDVASYVLTGRYNSDIGALVAADRGIVTQIMKFRQSQAGEAFRKEVSARLHSNEGGHFAASVNAGLRQALPPAVLQSARDQLSGLFEPRGAIAQLTPALWGDLRNADARIAGWRKRSRAILDSECARLRVGAYDLCPCGSGEKLKFCCLAALSSQAG